MACILRNILLSRRSEIMAQIINMFWVVVVFWLVIEVINSRINRNRKLIKLIDDINNEKL